MSLSAHLANLNHDQIEWLMVTANCLLVQKCPEQAVTLLEFLLCHEPEHQQALQMLGYSYYLAGRYEDALVSLNRLNAGFQGANPISLLLKAKTLAALNREKEAGSHFDAFSLTLEQTP